MYTGGVFRFVYLKTKLMVFAAFLYKHGFVFWYEQAEIAMRQAGKAGMSDEEVLIRFD